MEAGTPSPAVNFVQMVSKSNLPDHGLNEANRLELARLRGNVMQQMEDGTAETNEAAIRELCNFLKGQHVPGRQITEEVTDLFKYYAANEKARSSPGS